MFIASPANVQNRPSAAASTTSQSCLLNTKEGKISDFGTTRLYCNKGEAPRIDYIYTDDETFLPSHLSSRRCR